MRYCFVFAIIIVLSYGCAQKVTKTEKSKLVGAAIARKATELGISKVVFDRGGNLYHGRVKAVADGAREGGLNF